MAFHKINTRLGHRLGHSLNHAGGSGRPPFSSDLAFDFYKRATGSSEIQNRISPYGVATVQGGYEAVMVSTSKLSFIDLTGVTIVSQIGTSTATISGNDITFSAGVMRYLELSDGTILYFNNHTIDSKTGDTITATDITFQLNNSDQLKSIIDALDYGYYKDSSGNNIINPQYSPTGGTAYAGGKVHNLIPSYLNYEPDDTVMSGESEQLVNSFNWVDSNSDGMADNWSSYAVSVGDAIPSIDVGQKITSTIDNGSATSFNIRQFLTIQKGFFLSFKIRGSLTTNSQGVSIRVGNNYTNVMYTIDLTTSFTTYFIYVPYDSAKDNNRIQFTSNYNVNTGDWFEVDDVSIKWCPSNYDILDRSNTTTQTADSRSSAYYDSDQPFLYYISNDSNNEVEFDTLQTYHETAYKSRHFSGYKKNYCDKDYMFEDLVYATKKEDEEYVKVLNYIKYFCSSRTYLTDSNGDLLLNSDEIPIYT